MNDIEQKALALLNEVAEERMNLLDGHIHREITTHEALCRAIEQHEAFRQEVSDAVTALLDVFKGDSLSQGVINGHLHQFILPTPKPDPLVDVLLEIQISSDLQESQHDAIEIRKALDALGFEIREKSQ